MTKLTTAGSALGINPGEYDRNMIKRGGAGVVGDLVAVDLYSTDAAVTNATVGSEASIFSNVVDPLELQWGYYGILLDAVVDDAKVRVRFEGIVRAKVTVNAEDTTPVIGSPLIAATDGVLAVAQTTTPAEVMVIGTLLEAQSGAGVKTNVLVLMHGMHHLGIATDIANP